MMTSVTSAPLPDAKMNWVSTSYRVDYLWKGSLWRFESQEINQFHNAKLLYDELKSHPEFYGEVKLYEVQVHQGVLYD